jgi:DNA-binding NtrC family response regulator
MTEIVTGLVIGAGGSFLNFVTTKVYNKITGSSKNFIWSDKEINLKNFKVSDDFNELKRRTKIVVVDDENSFPTKLFNDEGYSIDKWDEVKDYSKLENGLFDIIVLDIKGVAQHISEDDGLGVLVSLKKNNPAQIIISYSQHSFDLSKIEFFQLADEYIAKPSDFLKIKNIIDNLISSQFKPDRYISTLDQILSKNHIEEKIVIKIKAEIAKAIKTKKSPDWNKSLEAIQNKTELVKQVKSLGETIIKFYK